MHEEPDNFPPQEPPPGQSELAPSEAELTPVEAELTLGDAEPIAAAAEMEDRSADEQPILELEPAVLQEGESEEADPEEAEPEEAEPGEAEPEEAVLELEPEPPKEQYCIFRSGRERFCLHVLEVDEVVDWPRLTNLPLAPPFLMGIFNLRGTLVPVVDIAFTEVRRADLSPRQVVVACLRNAADGAEVRVGIAADEVIGTYSTSEELLRDEAPRDVPHCAGMLRHGDRLALALDLQGVLESFPVGSI